jgi:hypothetical protein
MDESLRDLAITFCYRPIRAVKDEEHIVVSLLGQAGYRVTQIFKQRFDEKRTELLWIMDNANWFPAVCQQLQSLPPSKRPYTLIWHTEPLPPPQSSGLPNPRLHFREILKILLRYSQTTDVYTNYSRLRTLKEKGIPNLLLVSTPARQQYLAENEIHSTYIPLGYHRDEYGYDMGISRDIDVLFLGALTIPRRKKLFRELRQREINLVTHGSWSNPAYWGESRTRLVNRTKIFLNLQRYAGDLSGARLILGMANKAMVISEPIYQPGDFVPGKHFISATAEEMPEIINHYLQHDGERESIADQGHKLVTQELTMERSISRILELIREHYKHS